MSDGQYMLFVDAVIAVLFMLIAMLCDALIGSGRSVLFKVRWTIYVSW